MKRVVVVIAVLLAFACATPELTPTTVPAAKSIATIDSSPPRVTKENQLVMVSPTLVVTPTIIASPTYTTRPMPEIVVLRPEDAGLAYVGLTSLEERVLHSDLILHAKLTEVIPRARMKCNANQRWASKIGYKFSPLKVLKGFTTGSVVVEELLDYRSESDTAAEFWDWPSEDVAMLNAEFGVNARDNRWEDREAILFLKRIPTQRDQCSEADESEGSFTFVLAGSQNRFRVDDPHNRAWLPADESRGDEVPVSFLLSDASNELVSRSKELVTLQDILDIVSAMEKALVTANKREESGYFDCLVSKFYRERTNLEVVKRGGRLSLNPWSTRFVPRPIVARSMSSTFSTGEDLAGKWGVRRNEGRTLVGYRTKFWLSGRDANLFDINVDSERSSDGYSERHDVQVSARDALLAGEYHFVFKEQDAVFQPCDYHDAISDVEWVVSVFDPDMVSHSFSFVPQQFYDRNHSVLGFDVTASPDDPLSFEMEKKKIGIHSFGWSIHDRAVEFRVYSDALNENHRVAVFSETADVGRLYRVRDALKTRREGLISFTWDQFERPWYEGERLTMKIYETP